MSLAVSARDALYLLAMVVTDVKMTHIKPCPNKVCIYSLVDHNKEVNRGSSFNDDPGVFVLFTIFQPMRSF